MNPNASINGRSGEQKYREIPLIECSEIQASFRTLDFVENLLARGGCSVVYGSSNVGKSFWALDLAAHVATRTKYRGTHEVDGGAVIYITMEGQSSFDNRVAALKMDGRLADHDSFYVVKTPINLLSDPDCSGIIEAIENRIWFESVQLVVVDTLSRAISGSDENSALDMTQVIASVDRIRKETDAHVMLIHHSGKDESKGARGHTSLRAAVDTEIEISRAEGAAQALVRVKKQRDLEFISPMAFKLEKIHLGVNTRGKPVTSCVVRHETDASISEFQSGGFKKSKPVPSHEEVLNLVPENGIQKKLLISKIRNGLNAAHRAADSLLAELVAENLLREVKKPSKTGQSEVHVIRCEDIWA